MYIREKKKKSCKFLRPVCNRKRKTLSLSLFIGRIEWGVTIGYGRRARPILGKKDDGRQSYAGQSAAEVPH